jgi:nucleotide-binding universal stress UspA family protein
VPVAAGTVFRLKEVVMFKKILIPLDGSALSARAVPVAYALAGPDTELILVRAIDPARIAVGISAYHAGASWLDELSQPHRKAAEQMVLVRSSLPADSSVDSYVTEGDAASTIVDTARDTKADLIVMASHGHSGLTRWMLGSVTERVIRTAPCPVLMVRGTPRFSHALVTLDGSALAEQALAPALAVTGAFHSQLTLLRAVISIPAEVVRRMDEKELGLGEQLVEGQLADAEEYLCRLAANGSARGAFKVAVPADHPAEAIARYVETHEVNLIVMATHGHTGLQRWTLGSVTEKVLRATECSMLVIRPLPKDGQTPA